MSYEYLGPHNPKTVEKLDRWTNQLEVFLSSASKTVLEKVGAALEKRDSYLFHRKQRALKFENFLPTHFSYILKRGESLKRRAVDSFEKLDLDPILSLRNFYNFPNSLFLKFLAGSSQPPPPKPIIDYEKAKDRGDQLALFLSNLIEPYKQNPDLFQLEAVLQSLYKNRKEEFKNLLERFTVPDANARYARHLVLNDPKLGIDIYVYVWLPHQYSDPHRHNSSDSIGIVLQGKNGRQHLWKSDGTFIKEDIKAGDIGFVSRDDTHQVFNNDNQEPLITFELFAPGLNAEKIDQKSLQKSTFPVSQPPKEFDKAIDLVKKILQDPWRYFPRPKI